MHIYLHIHQIFIRKRIQLKKILTLTDQKPRVIYHIKFTSVILGTSETFFMKKIAFQAKKEFRLSMNFNHQKIL